jgi:NAD-dependent dihydropyrimidine dehydrogenase PreA subunit
MMQSGHPSHLIRDIHHRIPSTASVASNYRDNRSRYRENIMAYVILDSCIKDSLCVDVCPTDCIHPKQDEPGFEAATQMYVDPNGCIDCGACVPVCTSDSIKTIDDLTDDQKPFVDKNAAFFAN